MRIPAALWGLLLLVTLGSLVVPAQARQVRIEALTDTISPDSVDLLDGLWCRNVDKIVDLHLSINWPSDRSQQETTGYQRLIFWNSDAEYLFPSGSYQFLHGQWMIDSYFIARSGGVHQGVTSKYFERAADTAVLLSPDTQEVQVKRRDCK